MKSSFKFQDEDFTCGPTCIQIILKHLSGDYGDIEKIKKDCDCNTLNGTTDIGMKNGLDAAGLKSERNTNTTSADLAFDYLDSVLDSGNSFIMRTLTNGEKHWVVCYKKDDAGYHILDPWIGKLEYDRQGIDTIWSERDFDGFEVFLPGRVDKKTILENYKRLGFPR